MQGVDNGKLAEYTLAVELLARGITPNWPSVETEPYDLITCIGSKIHRIQVKGTENENPVLRISTIKKGKLSRYTADDIDYFAIWIRPLDYWYFIPVEDLKAKTIKIYPLRSTCRWNKYQEAWHLLGIDENT